MTNLRLRNLMLPVALAVLAAVLVGFYVISYRDSVKEGAGLVKVMVASRDIPAAVSASISRIPGPPFGPSYRMTTTSPALICFAFTAAKASSSLLNTLAGPRCWSFFTPAVFTTQPSGARLPFRMARVPVGLIGDFTG